MQKGLRGIERAGGKLGRSETGALATIGGLLVEIEDALKDELDRLALQVHGAGRVLRRLGYGAEPAPEGGE
jgi:hypothetical protein